MVIHVARCSLNTFMRTSSIRVGLVYLFQDTVTIFRTSPKKSSAINASGIIEAVNTAKKSVA